MPHQNERTICYTFRRCPYAIRARMALDYVGIEPEFREIEFRNKPPAMLEASPKGTVPVLIDLLGNVFEQSRDIMMWGLQHSDPEQWLTPATRVAIDDLIDRNDDEFKYWLERYKYADRHPEFSETHYRSEGEKFLLELDQRLAHNDYLISNSISMADIALFPFIRQFSMVRPDWFAKSPYGHLRAWLESIVSTERFARVMVKRPLWQF